MESHNIAVSDYRRVCDQVAKRLWKNNLQSMPDCGGKVCISGIYLHYFHQPCYTLAGIG